MKKGIVFLIVILMLGFSLFCYHTRTNYNVDHLYIENKNLEYDVKVLSYALSLIPKELKNEVFVNSLKEKFPSIENDEDFIKKIKGEEKTEEEKNKEINEKMVYTKDMGINEIANVLLYSDKNQNN